MIKVGRVDARERLLDIEGGSETDTGASRDRLLGKETGFNDRERLLRRERGSETSRGGSETLFLRWECGSEPVGDTLSLCVGNLLRVERGSETSRGTLSTHERLHEEEPSSQFASFFGQQNKRTYLLPCFVHWAHIDDIKCRGPDKEMEPCSPTFSF